MKKLLLGFSFVLILCFMLSSCVSSENNVLDNSIEFDNFDDFEITMNATKVDVTVEDREAFKEILEEAYNQKQIPQVEDFPLDTAPSFIYDMFFEGLRGDGRYQVICYIRAADRNEAGYIICEEGVRGSRAIPIEDRIIDEFYYIPHELEDAIIELSQKYI